MKTTTKALANFYKKNNIDTSISYAYLDVKAEQIKKHFKGIISVSAQDLAIFLQISFEDAAYLCRKWRDNEGGKFVDYADLCCYYFG